MQHKVRALQHAGRSVVLELKSESRLTAARLGSATKAEKMWSWVSDVFPLLQYHFSYYLST